MFTQIVIGNSTVVWRDGKWIDEKGNVVDPVSMLKSGMQAHFVVNGTKIPINSPEKLIENSLELHKDYLKKVSKLREALFYGAKDLVARSSYLIHRRNYSHSFVSALQVLYGCRIHEVNVFESVSKEIEYRKGSSREKLLELLNVIGIREDNLDRLREFLVLFPALNAHFVVNVRDIVFCKLKEAKALKEAGLPIYEAGVIP